jgi:sugar lactone lactonase YvrE
MKPHLQTLLVFLLLSIATFAQTPAPERTAPPETPAFKKLLAPNATVEKLASGMGFTEGPLWHRDGYLLFTDVPRSKIMKWDAKNGLTVFREPTSRANGLGFDNKGRLVACEMEQRRISATEADGKVVALADKYNGKRLNTTNDLTVGRDGAIYFSDPGGGNTGTELDFNGVYRISPSGELTLLTKDVPRPNGLTFAPDGKTLYVADMGKQNVHAFDLKRDGTIANGRIFATIYPHGNNKAGVADGIKTDVKGNLYVTGYGGVWVFDKKGQVQGIIATPEIPSNCAFGDADFKTLYITARTSLYRIRLTVAGAK